MARIARWALAAVLVAASITGSGWLYVSQSQRANAESFVTVPITRGTIRRVVSTSGPVRALVTVQVGSQLSGQIIELRADFNTEVKSGDILALIDPKSFAVKVAQAKADLAAARASLVHEKAAIDKARAVLRQTEKNKERQLELSARGIASRALLESSTRDYEVAKADVAVAKAQVTVAEAQVLQREAALRQFEIDLDRTFIRAPIDGTVISRTVDQGQTVAASLQAPELFKIAQDLRRIRIEAQVNEADVGSISAGNQATFTVDAYPDRTFAGVVTQVRLAATELQNVVTYTVVIEAQNEDRRLFPGMTANVEVETARRPNVLRLPTEALRFRPPSDRTATRPSRRNRREVWQRRLAALKRTLSLSDEQVGTIRQGLRGIVAEVRGMRGGGDANDGDEAGRVARRNAMREKFERLVKSVLRDDQRQAFEKWQKRREGVRTAPIWVVGADGRPERRIVRIGVGDDSYLELRRGALKDGDRVIVRRQRKS
jgi:HlyD family secretion protein